MQDWTRAELSGRERALTDYAAKLTRSPSEMARDDVDALRAAGLDDAAIHDLAQVTALFNYYTRIVNGLGAEDEAEWGQR
jgi:uncharacterized peroxidase-related enzyme